MIDADSITPRRHHRQLRHQCVFVRQVQNACRVLHDAAEVDGTFIIGFFLDSRSVLFSLELSSCDS
jgi:hypothetical protein